MAAPSPVHDTAGSYRGRIAPSPTGYLHRGHLATFAIAAERAKNKRGVLVFREEDIDPVRCRDEYRTAIREDLQAMKIVCHEGVEEGGDYGPYQQSQRIDIYVRYLQRLADGGWIYPSGASRKEISQQVKAYSPITQEPLFPESLRESCPQVIRVSEHLDCNWRMRVDGGGRYDFIDLAMGAQSFVGGRDFSDFLVWRKEGAPSYELAVVVDDILMKITEVVRGADLLLSTARQLHLYRAFECEPPRFYHCPLILDSDGNKLSKRERIHLGRETFN